jgi:hypothetical protein
MKLREHTWKYQERVFLRQVRELVYGGVPGKLKDRVYSTVVAPVELLRVQKSQVNAVMFRLFPNPNWP